MSELNVEISYHKNFNFFNKKYRDVNVYRLGDSVAVVQSKSKKVQVVHGSDDYFTLSEYVNNLKDEK